MKYFLIILSFFMFSTVVLASNCSDLSFDSNWPLNKIKTLISCDRIDNTQSNYGDSACVVIKDDQVSNYNTTTYQILLYRQDTDYALITSLVSIGKNGYKNSGSMTSTNDGNTHFESVYTPNGLVLKSIMNLSNPNELNVQISKKTLMNSKIIENLNYRCHKIK